MVIPDYSRHQSDRAPGLVRELHRTLGDQALRYRNIDDADYDALVEEKKAIVAHSADGYVLGLPTGRQLRVYYEFGDLDAARDQLGRLVVDLAEVALARTDCETMVLDYNDSGHRHLMHPALQGAAFEELEWSLLRCRDIRDVDLLGAPREGVLVRVAAADGEVIARFDTAVRGVDSVAPPLPAGFVEEAAWVGLAEVRGELAGFLRIVSAGKRGLLADEFVVDPARWPQDVGTALISAAIEWGRQDQRRVLTVSLSTDLSTAPFFKTLGFYRVQERLRYRRPVDQAEIERRRVEKTSTYFKVGKIWGKW